MYIKNQEQGCLFSIHRPIEKCAKDKPDILRCDWTHEKMFNLVSDWLRPQLKPFYI